MPVQNTRTEGNGAGASIDWRGLARIGEKRIYFGHQSVGYNILEGIKEVTRNSREAALPVVEFDAGGPPPDSRGILHSKVGRNGRPLQKIEEFRKTVLSGVAGSPWDLAFLKFCYADFYEGTDVAAVFDAYKRAVQEIELERPGLRLIHWTVPLTTGTPTIKERIKKVLGRKEIEYEGNIKRNRFNDLLRAEYGGKAPLFDLARMESTRADGSRASFRNGDLRYDILAREYTDDGGHLNGKGRSQIALNFLALISGLARE